ncbi:MAG: flotillin-like FloA family protein [Prolixibacteraceae bacterium]
MSSIPLASLLPIIIVLILIFFYSVQIRLWKTARASGVNISLIQLFAMRVRKEPSAVIVHSMIEAHKAGLDEIKIEDLEAHYFAGGHVALVVDALVLASKASIEFSFQEATVIDLAGRDVLEVVQMSVNSKVIDTSPVTTVTDDVTA